MAHTLISKFMMPLGRLLRFEANSGKAEQLEDKDKGSDSDSSADKPMQCEVKHLDRRHDDEDNHYFCERKAEVATPEQKDWWRLYAFCVVRHYDSDGDLDSTELYVNPQPLRNLLADVIGDYPGNPVDVDDVRIDHPYYPLFHYRKQLEAEGAARFADDPESRAQLDLLSGWIRTRFEDAIAAHDRCLSAAGPTAIAYDKLWTLFPPGSIAYMKVHSEERAYRVRQAWYDDDDDEDPGMNVSLTYVDYDGDNLGTGRTRGFIRKYAGAQDLSELPLRPLSFLPDVDKTRERLVARGRRFESYVGQHYLHHDGLARRRTSQGVVRVSVAGRVMIDCKTFHRIEANASFTVDEFDDADKEAEGQKPLTDEEALIASSVVRGYAFGVKRFLDFSIDNLSPVRWNPDCFDGLVLDKSVKRTMQALVSTHARERDSFDDIVEGKGQGLVCVLHGPPGVGKTLTAECVAEYVKRPLYMVSSGDLGISSVDLDKKLTDIMDMAATWRAVLLIDEADVFLEARSLHDLHRNAMVSVFLRVLEYYSGILFLTTNRVSTFDDAFRSRIHVPVRYTDLSRDSRAEIWRNMCARVPGGVDLDEAGVDALAEHELNGRQIKNVIKAAESLAVFEGVKLDLGQLQQVTKIQATFEKDLDSVIGVDYTAPGSSKRNAEGRNMFL